MNTPDVKLIWVMGKTKTEQLQGSVAECTTPEQLQGSVAESSISVDTENDVTL